MDHTSISCTAISISLEEKQRHARVAVDIALPFLNFAIFHARICFCFIHYFETTNYANSTQKQRIQQISNEFFCLLLCSLCIFDKSSKATGYASLSVICQQEMNGYSELYSGLLYPVPSEDDYRGRAGEAEVSNEGGEKKSDLESALRNSSATLSSDI